jgi:hypothetical protein
VIVDVDRDDPDSHIVVGSFSPSLPTAMTA